MVHVANFETRQPKESTKMCNSDTVSFEFFILFLTFILTVFFQMTDIILILPRIMYFMGIITTHYLICGGGKNHP